MRRLAMVLPLLLWSVTAHAQEEISVSKIYLGFPSPGPSMSSGSGTPEGTVTASLGSVYLRTGTGQIYVKFSGSGNTGWEIVYNVNGTDVRVTDGGTGLSSWTTGDLVYASGATTLAGRAATTTGQVLVSAGVATPPAWTADPALTSVTSFANLLLNPAGDIDINPTGNDVLPVVNYDINLGMLSRKYLTLHAAELWVETLVAQNTIATIGGRILVGPTTVLTVDMADGADNFTVKHNEMAVGDRVYMEADGKVEFMSIFSGPTGGGPYNYVVLRNLDGTGANNWYAGDAIFNTGTTGDGFIDLYSVRGVRSATEFGPTIVGNVRNSTTYNDWIPRWAIGNLNGLYGYSGTTYGVAMGIPTAAWVKIDPSFGVRIGHNTTTYVDITTAGDATFSGKLTVGYGRNMLANSEFKRGLPGQGEGDGLSWRFGDTNTGLTYLFACGLATYFPVGGGECHIYTAGTPAASQFARAYGPKLPVVGGQSYEFSFYGAVHRGGALSPRFVWYDSTDTLISEVIGTLISTASAANTGGTALTNWGRAAAIAVAPSNATTCLIIVHQVTTAETNPYSFFTRMYFGQAHVGQTQPTEWGPGGVTLIDGDSLETDLVISNIIRSSGASALGTGTGFWLSAISTPTFRVGNPAGNRVSWDGTDLTVAAANVSMNSEGVSIVPRTDATDYTSARAYKWTVATGLLGISAADTTPARGMQIFVQSETSGKAADISMEAGYNVGGSNPFSAIGLHADSAGSSVTIGTGATGTRTVTITGLSGITMNGAVRMSSYGAGTAVFDASGNISSVSDERLKTSVSDYAPGLAAIRRLNPVSFKWTAASGLDTANRYVGFLAQDVAKALPYSTGKNQDGMLSLQDRAILAALVTAVQELDAKVKTLEREP